MCAPPCRSVTSSPSSPWSLGNPKLGAGERMALRRVHVRAPVHKRRSACRAVGALPQWRFERTEYSLPTSLQREAGAALPASMRTQRKQSCMAPHHTCGGRHSRMVVPRQRQHPARHGRADRGRRAHGPARRPGMERWMARARTALCHRLGSREACRTDWGPLGHPARRRAVAFGVDVNEGAFGSHELTLDMRVVDVATGADARPGRLAQRRQAGGPPYQDV